MYSNVVSFGREVDNFRGNVVPLHEAHLNLSLTNEVLRNAVKGKRGMLPLLRFILQRLPTRLLVMLLNKERGMQKFAPDTPPVPISCGKSSLSTRPIFQINSTKAPARDTLCNNIDK
jgi:hypothetical protein